MRALVEYLQSLEQINIMLTWPEDQPIFRESHVRHTSFVCDRIDDNLFLLCVDANGCNCASPLFLCPLKTFTSTTPSKAKIEFYKDQCRIDIRVPASMNLDVLGNSPDEEMDLNSCIEKLVFQCRQCESHLAPNPKAEFKRVAALPTPYWQEFLECWICHPADEHLEKYASRPSTFLARPGVVLSGSECITLAESDCRRGQMISEEGKEGKGGKEILLCRGCQSELGMKDSEMISLWKYRISYFVEGQEFKWDYSRILWTVLHQTHAAHAHSRFILVNQRNPTEAIALFWIFNWKTAVYDWRVDAGSKSKPFVQAAKIAFLPYIVSDSRTVQLFNQWTTDKTVDKQGVDADAVQHVLERLHQIHNQLPTNCAFAPYQFRMSYLPFE